MFGMKNIVLTVVILLSYFLANGQCSPGVITGADSVCIGASVTLSDTVSGGIWSSSNTSIATVNPGSGIITGVSGGTDTITYTLSGTCSSHYATKIFRVGTPPHIVSIESFAGDCSVTWSYDLSANPGGGVWSTTSTIISLSSAGHLTPHGADSATVTYTLTNSCGVDSLSETGGFTAPTNSGIIIGPKVLFVSDTVVYSDTGCSPPGYYATYGWDVSPWYYVAHIITAGTGTAAPAAVVADAPGTAYLTFTVYTFCGVRTTIDTITVLPTTPTEVADSFSVYINPSCAGLSFIFASRVRTTPHYMKTFFGDGTSDSTVIDTLTGIQYTIINHDYNFSGISTIKHVLYEGTTPIDSITYSYQHFICRDIAIPIYFDANSDCTYESAIEHLNYFPLQVEVDSNGVAIDTISVTSGLYYSAWGGVGDIYAFRIFGIDSPFNFSCPSTGITYDTLIGTGYSPSLPAVGLTCTSASGFDLVENVFMVAGRHAASGVIDITNTHCTPENPIVTLHISPKYTFNYSNPYPSSIVGNTVTWDFSGVDASTIPYNIFFNLTIPTSTWLTAGDTIHTSVIVTPTIGDLDTSNNYNIRIDSVKSSFDPNEMNVAPSGYILNNTTLKYAIEFENDGNDTAQNIYIMDTLSGNLDPSSLQIIFATAAMNISFTHYGTQKIVKFEFPNIKLLDSAYHGKCTGMVMFNIKPRGGLTNGTTISNHAGIFFDDNPVVMTGTVVNTIFTPQITVSTSPGTTICHGDTVRFTAAVTSLANSQFHWYVNGHSTTASGTTFVLDSANNSDSVKCIMTTILVDTTVINSSNTVVITVDTNPFAGAITGASTVCAGSAITLMDTASGCTWSVTNTYASISGGVVTGISTGIDTIHYAMTNACGSASATHIVTINPLPVSGTISGLSVVCPSASITLSETLTSGTWSANNTHATVSGGGIVNGSSAGIDTIVYTVTNTCGSAITIHPVTINPLPNSGTISGATSVCVGSAITLTDTASGCTWSATNSRATISGGTVSGIATGIDTINYSMTNSCGTSVATHIVTINPLPVSGVISGLSIICPGSPITLTDTTSGGIWSVTNSLATISTGGIVSGVTLGFDTISYTVTNMCGTSIASHRVTINPLPIAGTITGAASVCVGSIIVLTDTAISCTWSVTNGLATISGDTVSGITSGIDTVHYSTTNYCGTAIATHVVTINPLPVAGNISGLSIVCPGAPITLTDTSAGGIWTVTNSHTSISSGIVSGMTPGIDTIVYTVTNVCGTVFTTHPVTVNPLPYAGSITGAISVCPGSSVTLTDSITGGVWSLSNSHASHSGGSISGISPGNDTALYTVSNYCGSAVVRHAITINPTLIPDVSIAVTGDTICSGDSVTFFPTPINGGTSPLYTWKKFSSVIGVGTPFSYMPANGDAIKCVMVSDAICPSPDTVTSAQITFVVNPTVTPTNTISTGIGDSISYLGQIVTFNSEISYCGTAATYQWYLNGAPIVGATGMSYSSTVFNNDTVYCINSCNTPCATRSVDTSNTIIIYANYLTSEYVQSIQTTFSNLSLFPNPNNGSFLFSGKVDLLTNETLRFEILDITGKVIYKGLGVPENGEVTEKVNMPEVASGQYILRVVTENNVEFVHFLVSDVR